MTLVPVPADPAALDRVDDPGAVMVALVDQARALLAQAKGMEGLAEVVEIKSRAEAIRVYTQQKDMGHEAELSAAEIVRRAERRIGELIREGQEAGEIATRGDETSGWRAKQIESGDDTLKKESPSSFFATTQERRDVYAMTDDVTDVEFEEALTNAKDEGNLSRANVVRKAREKSGREVEPRFKPDVMKRLKDASKRKPTTLAIVADIRKLAERGNNSRQIVAALSYDLGSRPDEKVRSLAREHGITLADDVIGRRRKIDSNKVAAETVIALEGASFGLDLVKYEELNPDEIEGWVTSLSDSLKSLNSFHRKLKEMTR